MKKRTKVAKVFGVKNEKCSFGFEVSKKDGVIFFTGGPSKADQIYMEPKVARELAQKLLKSAEYLETKGT